MKMMPARPPINILVILVYCTLCIVSITGCEPVTRHKAMTLLFDGVPSLPPPEDLCKEYVDKMNAEKENSGKQLLAGNADSKLVSSHQPYNEKRCDDCHNKEKQDGLVVPKKELCFVCHDDLVNGTFVHGPVAVGDCLVCHLPHSANFPSLLKVDKSQICLTCHREKRLSVNLHDRAAVKNLQCPDCHDPHSGDARYFLK